jgi:hypothetical protein
LRAETNGGVLYQHTRRVELDGAARAFEQVLSYKQLFSRCFESRDADAFYVCVPNAGTSNSRLKLITVLRLEEAGGERGADVAPPLRALASESARTAAVDTYTVAGEVRVQKLEIQ